MDISDNYWELKRRLGFHYARLLMWWNDPKETKKQEFRLASQHLNDRHKKVVALHKDLLRCIIKLAGIHTEREKDSEVKDRGLSTQLQEEHASLLFKALVELCCGESSAEKQRLLAEGIKKLAKLNAKDEFDQFLKYADANGAAIDEHTVSEAARAFGEQINI